MASPLLHLTLDLPKEGEFIMQGDDRDNSSENDHWRALLERLGLETLQLPSKDRLAGPWKEFLEQLEAKESRTQKTKKEHR
jgi:hypothetical protein